MDLYFFYDHFSTDLQYGYTYHLLNIYVKLINIK